MFTHFESKFIIVSLFEKYILLKKKELQETSKKTELSPEKFSKNPVTIWANVR